jgi:hypothetical protein
MKDPCEECIVKVCCIEFCNKRGSYNRETRKLYLKNKDKHLFEKAIDDVMRIVKRKYPGIPTLSREIVKQNILENK